MTGATDQQEDIGEAPPVVGARPTARLSWAGPPFLVQTNTEGTGVAVFDPSHCDVNSPRLGHTLIGHGHVEPLASDPLPEHGGPASTRSVRSSLHMAR